MSATDRIPGETELDRLVARSRLIGSDPTLVLYGGGNTSSKILERDQLGRERRVLRVKGSGSDLATIERRHFSGVWLDEVLPLLGRERFSDEEMLAYLARCLVSADEPRPSVETLLHAFLPAAHVDHVHADAICALANAPDPERAVHEALGEDVAVVPYIRPGFELSRVVADLADRRAVVLAHHGLVTWGETHEESYRLTLELVRRAREHLSARGAGLSVAVGYDGGSDVRQREDFLVRLRGRLSREQRQVLAVDFGQQDLAVRPDVEAIAAARGTPDHMLRIGPQSCVLDLRGDVDAPIAAFESAARARYDRQATPDGPPMQSAQPRVFLVRGLGCVASAPDYTSARIRRDLAAHSHRTTAATRDAFGGSTWLDERAVFEFDYWPLELYKLTLAPPPPELTGMIVLVTGAASGIGRAVALDLAARGANLVLADIDGATLGETAAELHRKPVVSYTGDLTDPTFVDEIVSGAVVAFGGIDGAVFNAGVASTGALAELGEAEWRRSLEINLTAHFALTKRLLPVLAEQAIGGSLVYIASKNAFAPGAGFGSYSVAKAGLVQLAKIAALEGGPIGVRANIVNPDAIFGDSRLFSEAVRRQRAQAHGVDPSELEAFYASRSLLGRAVKAADVAESVAFLLSDRSRATTGCTLTVDGGVAAAFPR
ncbi:MAG TPA: bifunctional aldolase/short-chain dehydrogenase [Gaiellaceae bacterium]|nr:bifunctional aldolase/short-chain dehydrogenase [Gaiellaceae bacterium]HWB21750.1 bifunctional aldolase/short-chain dehydrogenase [Gaiellaceae bacterium]